MQVTSSQSELLHMVQVVVEFFKGEKFDGVVLEIWRQFMGRVGYIFMFITWQNISAFLFNILPRS